ncbi:VOC family protein [Inconstantimicrobium mannanitabidum]|uniref:VOC family protein n=1 Tax=Inconstantimicrobium mannanitabidum TaxID=1604901 RepID=A0ACB5RBW3_9CLOT|nr:VOC family protein [Clostridium sp. TW13]GKX66728.1 VOC family protein [Clostridium sp. TW13]
MKIGLQAYIQGTVEAVEFYQRAFGATLGYNVKNDDGTFMHAEINLDGQLLIALSEASSSVGIENIKRYSPTDYPTMNFSISLENEEAVKKSYEVLIEGGNILLPIGPLPWSACCANVIDKFGVFWYISV